MSPKICEIKGTVCRKILKVFLVRIVNKTEPFFKLKGQMSEIVFCLFSGSSGLGRKYLNFFHLAHFYRGMARFIAFGAVRKCAFYHSAPSPRVPIFNAPFS